MKEVFQPLVNKQNNASSRPMKRFAYLTKKCKQFKQKNTHGENKKKNKLVCDNITMKVKVMEVYRDDGAGRLGL